MFSLIALYEKVSGAWSWFVEFLPLLGALGSILTVLGSIAMRASAAKTLAELLHLLQPDLHETATLSVSFGLLKSHFLHQDNKAAIQAQSNKT